jgi:hypothetical protein
LAASGDLIDGPTLRALIACMDPGDQRTAADVREPRSLVFTDFPEAAPDDDANRM